MTRLKWRSALLLHRAMAHKRGVSYLLGILGPDALEEIVDPGIDVVTARLSDPATGSLSDACARAVARWYSRV